MEQFKEFLNKNRRALIGGAIGLIAAILMLTIGFFATLLIVLCTGLGALLSAKPEVRTAVKTAAKNLYGRFFKKG